ncbi:hypothetical protein NY78_3248 [Desulfovibrio sp. TomC]|nr:hypothetical protein NY78_3248 [Desulfovibrio sp. TomC]
MVRKNIPRGMRLPCKEKSLQQSKTPGFGNVPRSILFY